MKIAINVCCGGFGLSDEAEEMYKKISDKEPRYKRNDAKLIEVIETLGSRASEEYAKIVIKEIPDESTDWTINDYYGNETITYVLDGKLHYV